MQLFDDVKVRNFMRWHRVLTLCVRRVKPKIHAWEPVAKSR